ncbi:DUF1357 family protein (plasmid) [Borreliella yangtzensis]|uniref:Uncharacterized protein n=1 Tax=Borreliella yangtzensis TaxID=683292 RepID=A0ABR6PDZ4_9SPIR|nr:hypothetical protein [Borreliella yangtzensis]
MIEDEKKEIIEEQVKKDQQVKSDTKVINAEEFEEYKRFEEYMRLKEQANNTKPKETTRDLSINERIAKELAEAQERERSAKQLLLEADRINEIDTLAKAHLSSHFNKEALLAKGYDLEEIIQAQRRELVRKFVPIEQVKAISKISDISHIDGEILEQLVSLAKVNIKLRKNANSNSSSVDSIKGNIIAKSEESASLLDPNFVPIDLMEFLQALSSTYKQRRISSINIT